MPNARDLALLRRSAAALRANGETDAASEIDAAVARLEGVPTHRADLDSVRRGVFQLREGEDAPRPKAPNRVRRSTDAGAGADDGATHDVPQA